MPAQIGDGQCIAVERIERIARVAQRLEAHAARVYHQEPPTRPSPKPTISRIASIAIIEPSTPASAPSTPASAQVGTVPGGGGSGNRQR